MPEEPAWPPRLLGVESNSLEVLVIKTRGVHYSWTSSFLVSSDTELDSLSASGWWRSQVSWGEGFELEGLLCG